jgi:exonuclease SbcC
LVRLTSELKNTIERRDDLASRLAAAGPVPDNPETKAAAALKAAVGASSALAGLAAALETAKANLVSAEAALATQDTVFTEAQEKSIAASAAHATRLEGVPVEARDGARLALATSEARDVAEALRSALDGDREEVAASEAALEAAQTAVLTATELARDARTTAELAEADFLAACQRQGFAELAAHQAARLSEDAIEKLDKKIQEFEKQLAIARSTHERTAAAAAGLLPPDLPTLEAMETAAAAAASDASSKHGAARERASQASALLKRIREADEAFTQTRERHALVGNLSRQTRGFNSRRLSFEGFVLASLLDEALAAANTHLSRMLDGRYRLARREDPNRANAAVGLDIEVFDEWTGSPRPSGTLSGGEGFCAALALALGLAETVQAHAGARPVDALLIDEGFGSLDEDALDKAMEVLGNLQGGSRLVGIISHVADLKTRIPARLEVTPGLRGSTARFSVT